MQLQKRNSAELQQELLVHLDKEFLKLLKQDKQIKTQMKKDFHDLSFLQEQNEKLQKVT